VKTRVAKIEQLTSRVRRFTLVAERGSLPVCSGGSHIGVVLPTPGRTIRNSYSITSSPYQRSFLQIVVQRDPQSRGGSAWLHEVLREGDPLEITNPLNQFALARNATRHLLIAGGIGITPFISQIESLRRWGVPFELHYIYRGVENAAFLPQLRDGLRGLFTGYDTTISSRPDLVSLLSRQPVGSHVYVCGPASLIDDVVASATSLGWPKHHVHFERFQPPPQTTARPFVAKLAKTGREIHVPAEATLLDVLEREGIAVPYSCRIGGCGTCEVAVVGGEIDHRDHCWTDEDRSCGTRLLACVSRARNGHLHLDL